MSCLKQRLSPLARISLLFDKHSASSVEGMLLGTGQIGGRTALFYAQDFSVRGGSLSLKQAESICSILKEARSLKVPVIGIFESGGARIEEGADSLYGFSKVFAQIVRCSGIVPQISLIVGPTAGGSVYSPALTDFIFMTRARSFMFLTGPEVVRAATGEQVTAEQLGGSEVHELDTGLVDGTFENEVEMFQGIRSLFAYLPAGETMQTGNCAVTDCGDSALLNSIIPPNATEPYDMKLVVKCILDSGSFYELKSNYGANLITGFGRLGGNVVGIVANQPQVLSGALDCASSEKGAKFVNFCNAFSIPILTLVDVPGFLPGTEQESKGVIREGAKLLRAYASAQQSAKACVMLRKAFGGAYCVMSSKGLDDSGRTLNYAWPNAQVAVMGAKAAASLFLKKNASKEQVEEKIKQLEMENREIQRLVHKGYIDRIIQPSETRETLIRDLFSKEKVH